MSTFFIMTVKNIALEADDGSVGEYRLSPGRSRCVCQTVLKLVHVLSHIISKATEIAGRNAGILR